MDAKKRLEEVVEKVRTSTGKNVTVNFVETGRSDCHINSDCEVTISSGAIDAMNNDELAFSICHEHTHKEAKHQLQIARATDKARADLIEGVASAKTKVGKVAAGAMHLASGYLRVRAEHMKSEKEADLEAVKMMKQSGFDSMGAVSELSKNRDARTAVEKITAKHPNPGERLLNIIDEIDD